MRKPLAALAWAMRILLAKHTVPRREPPFAVDLAQYHADDYEKIIPSLAAVERQLKAVPADAKGMRWIHRSDAVLFYGERRFDVPYDDFVSQVDIGHVGRFYRDSLGVTTEVVLRDDLGRPVHQGVRVVALPQPNYTALMGKEELDVYKLEKIEYGPDEQRVWMLTVHSPNGSARCDDGYMSFARAADGRGTTVAFLACQSFPVPPLMALARMDRWTWFKTVVTESAYRRFCNRMMKNIERCYHGTEFRVGRPCG
ncbi:hypothetical protein [Allokutzneria albata]|uniref:START domain-containing protein n=1 Tax=Allokutzneria albata TaxID=211114 RepID=A0A1G9S5V7_ALLAB|nr:hypothetical protein [Allokutzneria albata]SDM30893.1 hypothetical protein SAMN04489726_0913 [Allokutzneria albata]